MIAPQIEPIQWMSSIVVLGILIVVYLQSRSRKSLEARLWLLPMAIWALHSLVFYSVLTIDRLGLAPLEISYTTWSSILRLHGYITVLGYEATRWYLQRTPTHYGPRT